MLHHFKSSLLRATAIAVCAVGLSNFSFAAEKAENPPELTDKVSEHIPKLAPLVDAKKFDEALTLIDNVLAKCEPNSFDRAFMLQIKAQVHYGKGDFVGAIPFLEESIKIAEQIRLFRFARILPMNEQESLINLSSLYVQSVDVPGTTVEMRRTAYIKAYAYAKRLIEGRKPTLEAQFTVARILYSLASVDGSKIDVEQMKNARDAAEEVLRLIVKPKEEHYTLLLACYQQLGDNQHCAQLLELLFEQYPNNKTYLQMLLGTYVAMQGSATKENKDSSTDLRAIITLERAQAAGQMKSPNDTYSLAGLYYNIGQYAKAADVLYKGINGGGLDGEIKNWELLINCYQQQNREDKAVETLLAAIKRFPKVASLEYTIGNIYYASEKQAEAYTHLLAAVNKGLERPAQTLVMVSYLALELKRLDDALAAAERALELDPRSKDAQNILKVIKDSIDERNRFINQAK